MTGDDDESPGETPDDDGGSTGREKSVALFEADRCDRGAIEVGPGRPLRLNEHQYKDHTRLHMEVPIQVTVPWMVYQDVMVQLAAEAELAQQRGERFEPDVWGHLNDRVDLSFSFVLPEPVEGRAFYPGGPGEGEDDG
jgi:hypothetical protein